jgi:hypothetical protein
MPSSHRPGDDHVLVGTTLYRVGMRVRLRPGLEGPDAGLGGRTGTIAAINQGESGRDFLTVHVDPEGGPVGTGEAPLQVYVVPSQVDLLDD